jgi:splicing factor U2AF subunit
MAKHLARIHGTEEDKVNCPFYFKIGACRHSDRCSRLHHKPAFSPTLLIKHLYRHPVRIAELQQAATGEGTIDKEKSQEDFLCFFEDLYVELSKFGRVEALHVCDNLGDHMIGHVYCKFRDEEEASDALQVMNGRYYDGRRMEVEFSPVTDFREARCRDFDEEACARGGFCNFLHVKPVPIGLIRSLEEDCEKDRRREEDERRDKEREDKRRRRKKRRRDDDRDSRKRSRKSSRRSSSRSRSRSRSRSDEDGSGDDSKDDRSYD